jgi:hypothetical protein
MRVLDRVPSEFQGMHVYREFIDRYEQGAPWAGYTDQEVRGRYQALVPLLRPDQFAQAAEGSLERFSPQNRVVFGKYIQQQAVEAGLRIPGIDGVDTEVSFRDPTTLGRVLADIHQERPDVLDQLLECRGGILDSLLLKATLAGIVAKGARMLLLEKQ